jgi:phosphoglycerate-specific signal transduction histidine kinase
MRIITDILDFSKIEAGKLEMEDIQFSLYDQLEHAVSVLAARANKKGLELACQVDQSVPDQIIGDPGRLFQVFVNLIGNWLLPASCTLSFSSKHIIDVMPFIIIIFLSVGEFPICWMPLMDVLLLQAIA